MWLSRALLFWREGALILRDLSMLAWPWASQGLPRFHLRPPCLHALLVSGAQKSQLLRQDPVRADPSSLLHGVDRLTTH